MRVTLPESQRGHTRGAGSAAFSTIIHALVLGVAVVATARSEVRRPVDTGPETIVYTRRVKPTPPPKRLRPAPRTGTLPPEQFTAGLVPDVVIPERIPPVDLPPARFDPSEWGRGVPVQPMATPPDSTRASETPFTGADVDRPAAARTGNPVPRYPQLLQQAGVEGSVTVRFVVDTAGRVEPGSIRVEEATHALFVAAVLDALRRMRFVPAEVNGRAVRQLVEQRFGFALRVRG